MHAALRVETPSVVQLCRHGSPKDARRDGQRVRSPLDRRARLGLQCRTLVDFFTCREPFAFTSARAPRS